VYTYCLQSPGHLFFIIITYLVITQNIPSSVSYKHDPTNPYLILLEWITGHNNPFPPTVTQIMTTSYILAYTEASFLLFRISYRKTSFHTNWIYIYIWINYQLDAIEYLLVYFQLDMFRAYTLVACCSATVQHVTSTHIPQDRHLATPRTPYAAYVKKM